MIVYQLHHMVSNYELRVGKDVEMIFTYFNILYSVSSFIKTELNLQFRKKSVFDCHIILIVMFHAGGK